MSPTLATCDRPGLGLPGPNIQERTISQNFVQGSDNNEHNLVLQRGTACDGLGMGLSFVCVRFYQIDISMMSQPDCMSVIITTSSAGCVCCCLHVHVIYVRLYLPPSPQ